MNRGAEPPNTKSPEQTPRALFVIPDRDKEGHKESPASFTVTNPTLSRIRPDRRSSEPKDGVIDLTDMDRIQTITDDALRVQLSLSASFCAQLAAVSDRYLRSILSVRDTLHDRKLHDQLWPSDIYHKCGG